MLFRAWLVCGVISTGGLSQAAASPQRDPRTQAATARLSAQFVPNRGQLGPNMDFMARGQGFALYLQDADATVAARGQSVGIRLLRSNHDAPVAGVSPLPGRVNYLLGRSSHSWITNVPTYGGARYRGVYSGIDLLYYVNSGNLEHDFIVAPGADPNRIRFAVTGAKSVRLDSTGDLVLGTTQGELRLRKPVAYQTAAGVRKPVAARFTLGNGPKPIVSFALGDYDRSRTLVIDPVLTYSTFIGGENEDIGTDIAVDANGFAYVCGATQSLGFPTSAGAFSTALAGQLDAFVTKLTPDGTGIVYSTYIGGQLLDQAESIRVDATGAAYVTGWTDSTNFPTTAGAFQTAYAGSRDTFTLKLHPSGGGLIYSTFVGGTLLDQGMDIQIGDDLSAYVTGFTKGNFPVSQEAYDPTANGSEDVFVYRVSPTGAALGYSTYVGGPGNDRGHGIDVNANGYAFVTGYAENGFPVTAGAFDTTYGGAFDAFVFRLDPTGSALGFCTYLGAGQTDQGNDLVLGPDNHPIITGYTDSAAYPTTPGAYSSALSGFGDAFVTVVSPGGAGLIASTFFGGASGYDIGQAVVLAPGDVISFTGSTEGGLPTTADAYDSTHNGDTDVFIARMNFPCSTLEYSTYVGGVKSDIGKGIDTYGASTLYVAGETRGASFPTTPGAFDTTFAGAAEAFALRLQMLTPTTIAAEDVTGQLGASVTLTATLTDGAGGLPGMVVDFSVDGTYVASGTTDATGKAQVTYAISSGTVGTRTILAEFAGDASYAPSTDTALLVVVAANTSIYVLDRSGTITDTIILRAYLRRVSDSAVLPGKDLDFSIDGTVVGTGTTGATGRADVSWTITSGPASRTIAADFAGDAEYNPSSGTAILTANTLATKMAGVDRSGRITAYTVFRAWLYRLDSTPVAGKTISFSVDGTPVGSAATTATGRAQVGYTIADGAGAGTRTILAEWAGDAGYLASSVTNTLTVSKATPYIWVMPRSVPAGGIANLYAYFRRLSDYQQQTGKTVDFKVDGTVVQTVVTDGFGIARYSYPTVEPVGLHTIRCEYYGDAWLDAGYGEGNLTIY